MLSSSRAFSSYSTDDLPAAKEFYGDSLGLSVEEANGILSIDLEGGQRVIIYPKVDHAAASFTVLNFEVEAIEDAVDGLVDGGVTMERYGADFQQDERGIARGEGPPIAWFKDPGGNILAVIQLDESG